MPNLDRLSSFSKKLKETKVVVQPGGGQDGTGDDVAAEVNSAERSGSTSQTASAPPIQVETTASAILPTGGDGVVVLGEIRDALRELTREVAAIRRDGLPGAGGGGEAASILGQQVGELRDHLQTQGVQLAEVLRLLRALQ